MAAMGSYNRRNRFKNLREGGSDNYETRIGKYILLDAIYLLLTTDI